MRRRTYRAPLPDERLWEETERKAMRRMREANRSIDPKDRAGWLKFCEREIENERKDNELLKQSIWKGVK